MSSLNPHMMHSTSTLMRGSAAREKLSVRIQETLRDRAAATLLSDVATAWTGATITDKAAPLISLIETTTPVGGYVGISYPNSATKAFLVVIVMMTGRIPVLISFSELSFAPATWLERAPIHLLFTANSPVIHQLNTVPTVVISPEGDIIGQHLDGPYTPADGKVQRTRQLEQPPDGVGLALFTSGSTGQAKGVLIPAEGLLLTTDHLIRHFGLNEASLATIVLPLCHSMALNTQFLPTFFAGGASHFFQTDMSFHRVYRALLEKRGTFVAMITTVLGVCWQEKIRHGLPPAEHVKHVQIAGGAISERHLDMALELFPNATIHKGYGLTEATRVTMISSLDPDFRSASVGAPLPFLEVEVRQPDGSIAAPFQQGEIFVKGASITCGFIDGSPTPVGADGFLVTGDIGYKNTRDQLCVIGRNDDLMKINGHRISGFSIEKRALESSEMIVAAKCMAFEDPSRQNEKIVLSLEIPSVDTIIAQEGLEQLQQRLWDQLRPLRYRPKEVLVFKRFPRSGNGKIQLQELRRLGSQTHRYQRLNNTISKTAFFHVPGHMLPERTSNSSSEGLYA